MHFHCWLCLIAGVQMEKQTPVKQKPQLLAFVVLVAAAGPQSQRRAGFSIPD